MTAVDVLHACFWGVLAAYIIHILDETLMNGGFTQKVKEHWWPEYHIEMFFWFNTCVILVIILPLGYPASFLDIRTGLSCNHRAPLVVDPL